MKLTTFLLNIWIILMTTSAFASSPYGNSASRAVQWLIQNQNIDGSWGGTDDVKIPCTVETVMALQALNQRNSAYYSGIAWLENHNAPNVDYKAHRILALASHGDNTQAEQAYIQSSQNLASPGNNGWGLTKEYQGAPLDSAMALLAYSKLGITTHVQVALDYLKTAQLTGADKGWGVAQETMGDPMTTSFVIQALTAYKSFDGTLVPIISNGVSSLYANVGTSSPIHIEALAALAYLRAGFSGYATSLLDTMAAAQSADGGYGGEPYTTALAARAFAASMTSDSATSSDIVNIPDPNLRIAVNKALGRNNMDAITKGDIANLTTLNAAGKGISSLTGLEWASNLVTVDLRNNSITSVSALNGLTSLVSVLLDGNPINYTLTISKAGAFGGTITSSSGGISCGSVCSAHFVVGTSVILTSAPDQGATFAGWSGACSGTDACVLTISSDTTVTGAFTQATVSAAFSVSATSGGAPFFMAFTDRSQNAESWLWDFGDGTTSSLQNPTKIYKAAGTYTTTLTVTNSSGSNAASQAITVTACTANTQVKVGGSYYATMQAAYDAATDGATIEAQAIDFAEDLVANAAKNITIDGGYMCGFTSNPDMTNIIGTPSISNGTVIMKNIHIK